MKDLRCLVVHWKAKNIPEVISGLKSVNCDILTTEYYPYPYNYRITRKFFLDHEEYTHLICDPNDLVVKKENYEKLIDGLENNDFPVLSGLCNVDLGKYRNFWNVCLTKPKLDYEERFYKWFPESQRKLLLKKGIKFQKFGWAGFPFMAIQRDIVKQIPFYHIPKGHEDHDKNNLGMMELKGGWAGDLAFCTSCEFFNIPIMVDITNTIHHLRFCGEMRIGKDNPKVYFEPANKSEIFDITNKFHN